MKYRTGIITSTRSNKVIGTGTQRIQRRLKQRAQAQAERPMATRSARSTCARNIEHYKNKHNTHKERNRTGHYKKKHNRHKNIIGYNRWLDNKGWWGTTADNRVPPRGTVGEPRHISSMNANSVCNHARNKSAESKPFDRPRDSVLLQDQNTSEKKQSRRGQISNEARLRRIEQRKQKRVENRRSYKTFMETIPREEWRLSRPTHRDSRALKARGTDKKRPGEANIGTIVIRKTSQ